MLRPTQSVSEENLKLMRFVAEKSKKQNTAMNITTLCRMYKRKPGTSLTVDALRDRIHRCRDKIHNMDEFDMETKARMMIAVSALVDNGFLIELRKHADVEVHGQRITRYEKRNKEQTTMPHPLPKKEVEQMLRIIARKTKDANSPVHIRNLAKEIIQETGSSLSVPALKHRIDKYRHKIPDVQEFDMATKTEMMFALSVPVNTEFLIELRKLYELELDEVHRIVRFRKTGDEEWTGKWAEPKKRQRTKSKSSESGGQKPWAKRRKSQEGDSGDTEEEEENDEDWEFDGTAWMRITDREANQTSAPSSAALPTPPIHRKRRHTSGRGFGVVGEEDIIHDNRENLDPNHHQKSLILDEDDDLEVIIVEQSEQKPLFLLPNGLRSPEDVSSTSVKNFLILLRGAVSSVKSPSLVPLVTKIESRIRLLEDQRISLDDINIPFDACLLLLMRFAAPKCPPDEESISLRDFLMSLKFVTCHISHPSIESFHQRLETIIFELSARDKRIPVKIVHRAIEATLIIIDP